MNIARRFLVCMMLASAALSFVSAASAVEVNQQIQESGPIFTYLLDTGTPSAGPLSAEQLAAKTGWSIVAEEDAAHVFAGDAVIMNDRIALVLRQQGDSAEVYTLGAGGARMRARLLPRDDAGGGPVGALSCSIVECSPGAVEVQAVWGVALSAAFRVNTGQIQVQISPGAGVDALQILGQTDHIVVPDFFADDIVYGPQDGAGPVLGLPAESLYLHLGGGGDFIATSVWERSGRGARALFAGDGSAKRLAGSEIECREGKKIWVAFAEHADLWRAVPLTSAAGGAPRTLDWMAPFDAKWRGNLAGAGVSRSWGFAEGAQTAADRVCWFEQGRPMLQLPESLPTEAGAALVIYPIDRTQSTPLDMFLLVDIMRSTLGVGPCQYILDLEGLDAQTTPTPALVTEWLEQQLAKKKNRQDPEKMKARLAAMVKHVEEVEKRIAAYAETASALEAQTAGAGPAKEPAEKVIAEMQSAISELAPARRSVADAQALAAQVEALFGAEDWKAAFEPLHAQLVAMGSAEDRTLAKCRMALRRLQQLCQTAAATGTPLYTTVEKALGEAS